MLQLFPRSGTKSAKGFNQRYRSLWKKKPGQRENQGNDRLEIVDRGQDKDKKFDGKQPMRDGPDEWKKLDDHLF
jgi:hypothetical protein